MNSTNLFDSLPENLDAEVFEDIVHSSSVRIERIASKGQSSPEKGWYNQDEHEWVLLVEGCAVLEFSDGAKCNLSAGDYINIPAHTKHKVAWTDPDKITVWLAVFYQ